MKAANRTQRQQSGYITQEQARKLLEALERMTTHSMDCTSPTCQRCLRIEAEAEDIIAEVKGRVIA